MLLRGTLFGTPRAERVNPRCNAAGVVSVDAAGLQPRDGQNSQKRCPRPSQDRELSLTTLADKPLPKISEDRASELSGLNVKSVI
jgi:hypothetical protein